MVAYLICDLLGARQHDDNYIRIYCGKCRIYRWISELFEDFDVMGFCEFARNFPLPNSPAGRGVRSGIQIPIICSRKASDRVPFLTISTLGREKCRYIAQRTRKKARPFSIYPLNCDMTQPDMNSV